MTRDEAERPPALRGPWGTAKVDLPEDLEHGPYTETIEAAERPSPADDPRTGNEKRLPGLPGGIG